MAALNGIVTRLFDLVCGPLGGHPAWAMTVIAVVTGVWALALFKAVTPQKRLSRQRDRLVGHLLEMGMYPDHLRVLARIQRDLALANLRYLSLSAPALLVLLVPMVLTLAQLEGRFAHRPLRPGEDAVLVVRFAPGADPGDAVLDLPGQVDVVAGPVTDGAEGAVAWRLRPGEGGDWPVTVLVSGRPAATATVRAGSGLPLLGRRLGAGWWEKLLYPGWPSQPADSPVRSWDLQYPARDVAYLGVRLDWLVAFMILSILGGLAVKDLLGVEM